MRQLLTLLLPVAIVACGDSAAPHMAPQLEGRWSIVDTTYNAYVSAQDGSHRVRAWINEFTVDFTRSSDSTFSYHAVAGSQQTTFDSIGGQGFPPQTVPMLALHADALVRGDTAYVTYLGKLDLTLGTADAITVRRSLPDAECLDALGGLANPVPAPVCHEAHHWSRAAGP